MNVSDYYYILTYSGTFFLLNSIVSFYKNNNDISLYMFFLFLTTILNWNTNISGKYKIIKKIDKFMFHF